VLLRSLMVMGMTTLSCEWSLPLPVKSVVESICSKYGASASACASVMPVA
jgi:hypothetical protein